MRHDAGAGGAIVGQLDKAKVLTAEHAGIKRQFGNGAGNAGQREGYVALHLAASHLGIDHIVVECIEAQQAGGEGTVEGERGAVSGCRAQRIAVAHLEGCLQEEHVVHQALGIGAEPETEGGGHGYLQMGVARHQHVLVTIALRYQHVKQLFDGLGHFLDLCARKEFQVEQHLVVTRTAAVNLLAYIAQTARQHQFHLRMDILDALFDDKFAPLGGCIDGL